MKTKKIMTILLSGTLLTSLALTPVFAGYGPGRCDDIDDNSRQERMADRMEQHLAKMTTVLELTDVQQTQVRDILESKKEQRQAQFKQRCKNHDQMQELKSADEFDEIAFRAMAEKRSAERIDMQVERMKTKQQILALLTAEQQEKADVFFQAMGKRGSRHGHGMKH